MAAAMPMGGAADTKEGEGYDGEDAFYLPADFPGHEDCQAGDRIVLTVLGKNESGEVEVKHEKTEKGDPPWKKDLMKSMGPEAPDVGPSEVGPSTEQGGGY